MEVTPVVTFRIKSKNPLDLMKFGVILNTIFREMPTGSRNSVWIVCGVRCPPPQRASYLRGGDSPGISVQQAHIRVGI